MKSKMLFFNVHIVLDDLKRYWGMAVLYFGGLFFSGPLHIMSLFTNENKYPNEAIENFLNLRHAELQMVLSIFVPVVLAGLLFRYLQQNKSTTLMHSFPITRGQLFHSHNIAGVLLLMMPIVLIGLVLMVILNINHDGSQLFEEIFTISDILKWVGFSIISNLVVYFISVLVATITGISLIQMVLSLISIFLPVGISVLIVFNFDQLLYGFVINQNLFENFIIKIIPCISSMGEKAIDSNFIIWYILLSIILYFMGYGLYKKRHLESASDPIAFELLKPIFKYGFTFCSMILGGAYLYMMERVDLWLYIGYFIGALLGYLIAEMIIQKSIWIFKNLKGFAIYTMVILVVFAGIKFDLVGYEKRVPNVDDIESVYYGNGLYGYWSNGEEGNDNLKTSENIHLVRELHLEVIAHKDEFIREGKKNTTKRIGIAYELKNGKTIVREYDIPKECAAINESIAKIYESTEYKINYYDIFDLDPTEVAYIEMDPELKNTSEVVKIVATDEIEEMIQSIKSDMLDETYKDVIDEKRSWARIYIHYDELKDLESEHENKRMYLTWEKHYKHLPGWLKENGYYEKARLMPKDIEYMVIEKTSEELKNANGYNTKELAEGLKENTNKQRLEIRNKDQIEEMLVNDRSDWPDEKRYIIGIYYTNGDSKIDWMDQKDAPEFVKNFFK
ncbi:hypothetical protein IZY60_07160 [Lutibacter sp. B2]|nr:hypothetical protein [Lutibacter sp. B2]